MKKFIIGYDSFETPYQSFKAICIMKQTNGVPEIITTSTSKIMIKLYLFLAKIFKITVMQETNHKLG